MKTFEVRMQERRMLNAEHKENPKVGDYWQEHLVPMCVVAAVTDNHVYIHTKTVQVPPNHWMWDFNETTVVSRKEFINMHRYTTIEGYWCDVCPEQHLELFKKP